MRVNQKEEVAVTLRIWTVAVLGAWLGIQPVAHGQEPGRLPFQAPASGMMPGEPMAQTIARRLRESGQLSHYRVNVAAQNGVVDLTGEVTDEGQREAAVSIARAVAGVQVVRDWVQVRPEAGVTQAQLAVPPQPLLGPGPMGPKAGDRIDGQLPEPAPIFQAPMGPNPTLQPPPMPPYAWPTYAPYNNYSRVAYPTSYGYDQFPFIGPMYPFPRVPLGWRSVSLTWEDGTWYFHRSPSGHDWWRIRYH